MKAHPMASSHLQVRLRTIETMVCHRVVRISCMQTLEPALPASVQEAARALQAFGATAEWRPHCDNCATLLPDAKARWRCAKCEVCHYCSKDCQASHWRVHKTECRASSASDVSLKSASAAASNLQSALQALALRCLGQRQAIGDNSQTCGMHLFVAALQQLADAATGAQLLEVLKLDKLTFGDLQHRARATLHVFVIARALLPRGFRSEAEVSAWVLSRNGIRPCETPAGWVPSWLLKSPEEQRKDDPWFSEFRNQVDADGEHASVSADEARNSNAVRSLLDSPLAEYTAVGGAARQTASVDAVALPVTFKMRTLWQEEAEGKLPIAPCGSPDDEWRQRGDEACAKRDFRAADKLYSEALELDPDNAELLAHRAAVRVALNWFTSAAADAAAAAAASPGWAEAHYLAAQAYLGCKDGAAAAAAARAAAQLVLTEVNIARVLVEAERMEEEQRGRKQAPDPRAAPELWSRVLFPENVHVIGANGGTVFGSVADALHELRCVDGVVVAGGGLTLILLPGVYEEPPITLLSGEPIQLLGWNDPTSGKGAASELRLVAPDTSAPKDFQLITAFGAGGGAITLERLRLVQPRGAPHTTASSCGLCVGGATMHVLSCIAATPDSPCFLLGDGSSLTLNRVRMTCVHSGVIARGGALEADGCEFGACKLFGLELCKGDEAVVRNSSFNNCTQAIVMHKRGSKLEVHETTIRNCGGVRLAAVVLDTGTTLLRACTICDCPTANAIMLVGGEEPGAPAAPVLLMDGCSIVAADIGVAVAYGSAALTNCKVLRCSSMGVGVYGVPPRKLVMVRGSKLSGNGHVARRKDTFVASRSLFESSFRLDNNSKLSVSPVVPSDAEAAVMAEQVAAFARSQTSSRLTQKDVKVVTLDKHGLLTRTFQRARARSAAPQFPLVQFTVKPVFAAA